jgi:hypothetical protein
MPYNKNVSSNCMGYAVGVNDWLVVGNYKAAAYDMDSEYEEELVYDKDFTLIPVHKRELKLGKEYIAYRFGYHDFHFCKRDKKGHWRHKMGSKCPETISQKKVFAKKWDGWMCVYNSKLYLYEIVKNN